MQGRYHSNVLCYLKRFAEHYHTLPILVPPFPSHDFFSFFFFLFSRNGHALHRFPRVSFMRARESLGVILHRFSSLHIFLNLVGSELFGEIFRLSCSRRSRLSIAQEIAEFPFSRLRSDCGSSNRIVVAFLSYLKCRTPGF